MDFALKRIKIIHSISLWNTYLSLAHKLFSSQIGNYHEGKAYASFERKKQPMVHSWRKGRPNYG